MSVVVSTISPGIKRMKTDPSRKEEADNTNDTKENSCSACGVKHFLGRRFEHQPDFVLGVHVPAWAAVPLIVSLRIRFVHPVHAMSGQVDDRRRKAY